MAGTVQYRCNCRRYRPLSVGSSDVDTGNPEVGITRVAKKSLHPSQAPLNAVWHMREKFIEQQVTGHLG